MAWETFSNNWSIVGLMMYFFSDPFYYGESNLWPRSRLALYWCYAIGVITGSGHLEDSNHLHSFGAATIYNLVSKNSLHGQLIELSTLLFAWISCCSSSENIFCQENTNCKFSSFW